MKKNKEKERKEKEQEKKEDGMFMIMIMKRIFLMTTRIIMMKIMIVKEEARE